LWTTDGTAAGTHGLTGIAGAATTGIDPTDMMVCNNEVLFNGVNASGRTGLWETDGTAGGTHELTSIAGVNSPTGLNPTNLTVFDGGEVLFSGLVVWRSTAIRSASPAFSLTPAQHGALLATGATLVSSYRLN
jgi:ELWxxDGT repeat protein